jgi:hypothetical protein
MKPLTLAIACGVVALVGASGCGSSGPAGSGGSPGDSGDSGESGLTTGSGAAAGSAGSAAAGGSGGGQPTSIVGFDPASADNIATAFLVAGQYAATLSSTSVVRFAQVQGTPMGQGDTYMTTPFHWIYRFSMCDTAADPCPNPSLLLVEQPGWLVQSAGGPFGGLSLSQPEFAAAVPFDLTALLGKTGTGPAFCAMVPTPNNTAFILLAGGVKSGSGKPLWYWEFSCSSTPPTIPNPLYFDTNGDPIT